MGSNNPGRICPGLDEASTQEVRLQDCQPEYRNLVGVSGSCTVNLEEVEMCPPLVGVQVEAFTEMM